MTPEAAEWIAKAEDDWIVCQREYRARKRPVFDAACYHAQQCVEKYLKAILVNAARAFPRTHDLAALLDRVSEITPFLESFRPVLNRVSDCAVQYRYPGDSATREEAREVLGHTRALRRATREHFGLAG